jgi:hypothetical protein
MKKRPLSIVLISIFYFIEPIGNLAQAAFINKMPLLGRDSILSHLLWSDWIILGLFPVVGVGIYMVKKWGWYLFLGFSALLIFYNIYVYKFLNPNYPLALVVLFIVIITAISFFFMRKNVYAPYFNPRLRWWEVAERYKVPLTTVLVTKNGAASCKTVDISKTGCFVNYEGDIPIGSSLMIEFQCGGIEISCLGELVNRRSNANEIYRGYGIRFQAMPAEMKEKLKHLLWYFERIGLEDRGDNKAIDAIPEDISWLQYKTADQIGFRLRSSLTHHRHF